MPHDDMTDGFDDFRDGFFVAVGLVIIGFIIGVALMFDRKRAQS